MPGTPCEPAITKKTYLHIPENVVQLFPGDPDLPKLGAVSYMGYPLLDPRDNVLGNIAVLDTKPKSPPRILQFSFSEKQARERS